MDLRKLHGILERSLPGQSKEARIGQGGPCSPFWGFWTEVLAVLTVMCYGTWFASEALPEVFLKFVLFLFFITSQKHDLFPNQHNQKNLCRLSPEILLSNKSLEYVLYTPNFKNSWWPITISGKYLLFWESFGFIFIAFDGDPSHPFFSKVSRHSLFLLHILH